MRLTPARPALALLAALATLALPSPARAATLRSGLDGYSLTVPDGWQRADQQGVYVLASEAEGGAIVISWAPGLTAEQMRRQAAEGMAIQGVRLTPIGAPQTLAGAAGVAVDLQGVGADGAPFRARAVGVAGQGGGLVVIGLAPPDRIAAVGARVDAIAGSARFFAPERGAVAAISGSVCASSGGGGGYGSAAWAASSRMAFDGAGGASRSSSFAAGGGFQDSAGAYAGGWSGATSGGAEAGSYAVSGERVQIRWADGSMTECTVQQRQGGQITGLRCGDQLWAAGLCG